MSRQKDSGQKHAIQDDMPSGDDQEIEDCIWIPRKRPREVKISPRRCARDSLSFGSVVQDLHTMHEPRLNVKDSKPYQDEVLSGLTQLEDEFLSKR